MKQNFKLVRAWAVVDKRRGTLRTIFRHKLYALTYQAGYYVHSDYVIPVLITPISPKNPKPRRNPKSTKRT